MLKFAVPAVAALGLLAVAAQSQSRAPGAEAQPMGWHFYTEGDMAKLAYGVANSDVLTVMMTCQPGDRMATVYGAAAPDSPRVVKAASVELDPLSGGAFEESRVPLNDPVLRDLAGKGVLKVKGEVGRAQLKASDGERRLAGAFFAHCAPKAA